MLGEIAAALSRGRTTEQRLAANGRRYRLGSTMAEAERHWRQWAATRYGPAPRR